MRILVTGATGVVGRRLVPALIRNGHVVTAAGRSPARCDRLRAAGASVIALDLFDPAAVSQAVAGHDSVISLATHIPATTMRMFLPGAWRENDRLRRVASGILADAARAAGARRYVQESFAPVYQDGGGEWITETSPVRPARYNATVLNAERSAARFTAEGGIGIALRFGGFYGPDSGFFHEMLGTAARGWMPLPGAPDAFFSSVSHDDAATAVLAALELAPGIYNVVDDEPLTRRELSEILATLVGRPGLRPMPKWLTALSGSLGELMSRSLRISNRKLRDASAWRPAWSSAREGLRAAAEASPG